MGTDTSFAGSIPQFYERYFVPLIFAPYAADIAARVAAQRPRQVLEVAAGTGVVTRELARLLDTGTDIVATDLNEAMLIEAQARGTARPVRWQAADAMQLPFADASFDAVVCQFGAMFFPERAHAYAQARRVLRPGGRFFFNVWDRIELNEVALVVTEALATVFPADPPRFMARVPHGYHDTAQIARDLALGGFSAPPRIDTVAHRSRADAARDAAIAYCQGTPLRSEIEARGPGRLDEATDVATAAIAARFGAGPIDGLIQAHLIEVVRA